MNPPFNLSVDLKVVPDIKLTYAHDRSSNIATFNFVNPNVFNVSTASGRDITGMFLIDNEGEIKTTYVNAKFLNGKPQSIESILVMQSPEKWGRFMRFMDRYAEANGLGFTMGYKNVRLSYENENGRRLAMAHVMNYFLSTATVMRKIMWVNFYCR